MLYPNVAATASGGRTRSIIAIVRINHQSDILNQVLSHITTCTFKTLELLVMPWMVLSDGLGLTMDSSTHGYNPGTDLSAPKQFSK